MPFGSFRKVRNRAYRALNEVLNLEGSVNLGQMDLGAAFPVHGLREVVQAGLVDEYSWGYTQADGAGGATTTKTLRPFTTSDWSRIVRNDEPDVEFPFAEADCDIWITHMGVWVDPGTALVEARFWSQGGYAAAGQSARVPITGLLDQVSRNMAVPAAGSEYYLRPMPTRWRLWDSHRALIETNAVCDWTITYLGFVAPRGVLPKPGRGS